MDIGICDQLQHLFNKLPEAVSLAEEIVLEDHAQRVTFHGRAAVVTFFRALFVDGFAGAQLQVHTALATNAALVLEFVFAGRHRAPFQGIPATGREVAIPMALVCSLANAQVERVALYYDAGTFLQQLGLAP